MMADLKRGTEVEVTFRGRMVGRPYVVPSTGLGIARVSVERDGGHFWAVVPAETVTAVEETEDG
jgi:hypothetical protein